MMKHTPVSLSVLLVVLMTVCGGCASVPPVENVQIPDHSATRPVPRQQSPCIRRHELINERVAKGGVDLVFVGDSITELWENEGREVWKKYYGRRNAANLGISGDCTEHVAWRIDNGNFNAIAPRLVIVMIGTNNTRFNTPGEIADGVALVVRKVLEKAPKAKVLLLGIFPRGKNPDNPGRLKVAAANKIIRDLADGRTVRYLDIGEKFLDADGTLPGKIMPDALHPSPEGYEIWAQAIEPTVKKLLGE
ncbi:MAG: GDSL family lipase [Lentisphaerae bacterium]|nr:GDSL family lipase [Lentisphaerota bacterium]